MVAPHPNLQRKFINTNSIVDTNKSESIHNLHSKYPGDYINITTHKVMDRLRPWAEMPSPILKQTQRFQFNSQSLQYLQPIVIDKILVLCIDFPDKHAQLPISTIYNRFFGDNVNSLKEYYREVSYERYIPQGEIYGWYRAPNPSAYYADKQNGFGTYPKSTEKLVEDVLDAAFKDQSIIWDIFDTNNNGYIDNLIVVHAGAEAAYTGNIDDLWANVYAIPTKKIIQGKIAWVYALTSEYVNKPTDQQAIGGDAHEHGHQLGLPDLYDTTYKSSGVGSYSLMGAGSWGNDGLTPVHLDAWSKYVLGFADTIENPVGSVYLESVETNPNSLKYTTSDTKEYYLVESREKILYDKYLPSQGLFVWHINEHQIDNLIYNDDKSCYLVGLEQADGLKDLENNANNGDLGDPFPGISNNRSFGENTKPHSVLCNGKIHNVLIDNISDLAKIMTFDSFNT